MENIVENIKNIDNIDNNKDMNEPILDEKNERLTVFPIEYKDIWDLYKVQEAAFWKAEEIDFSRDYDDFENSL